MNIPAPAYKRHPQMPLLTCSVCGITNDHGVYVFPKDPEAGVGELCVDHASEHRAQLEKEQRKLEGDEILKMLPTWTREQLVNAGLRDEELNAALDRVPEAIASKLPDGPVNALLSGMIPRSGFGLCGTSNAGKTMALASILSEAVMARAKNAATILGKDLKVTTIRWVCWSTQCGKWRLEGGDPNLMIRGRLVRDWSTVRLLVLDDLGREGTTGGKTYMDDPCTRLLDLIVSERDAANLPTLWTSNLDEKGLIVTYGAALHRRLVRLNQAIYLV